MSRTSRWGHGHRRLDPVVAVAVGCIRGPGDLSAVVVGEVPAHRRLGGIARTDEHRVESAAVDAGRRRGGVDGRPHVDGPPWRGRSVGQMEGPQCPPSVADHDRATRAVEIGRRGRRLGDGITGVGQGLGPDRGELQFGLRGGIVGRRRPGGAHTDGTRWRRPPEPRLGAPFPSDADPWSPSFTSDRRPTAWSCRRHSAEHTGRPLSRDEGRPDEPGRTRSEARPPVGRTGRSVRR